MKKSVVLLSIIIIIVIILLISITGKTRAVNNISELEPDVEAVTNSEAAQPSELGSQYREQWSLFNADTNGIPRIDINLMPYLAEHKDDSFILVGVMDTGIDINHKELTKYIFTNENEIPGNGIDDDNNGHIDDINGWDFVNNDNTVFDYWGLDRHGTQSAGIIKIVSENANVRLIPLKIMEGTNLANTDVLVKAIDYAKKMNIKIINCSWQAFAYDEKLEAAMRDSDILFVCAAGNSSCDVTYLPSYPACFELANIISVASIDNKGEISAFSNYGSKIHIAAPGENIVTTIPEDKYELVNGTSIAAPFVTGVAAILAKLFSDLPKEEIAKRIRENAFRIDNLTEKVSSGGIVDAYAAISNENKSLNCPEIKELILYEDKIELVWDKVDKAASYEIEVNRTAITAVKGSAYKYQIEKLEGFNIFRIRAVNGETKSKWSISKWIKNE